MNAAREELHRIIKAVVDDLERVVLEQDEELLQ